MIYIQIVISLLLIGLILIQGQSSGKGILWEKVGGSYHTKRGAEKSIFILTIVLAFLFIILAIINLISG